jgi:hypothetical protein
MNSMRGIGWSFIGKLIVVSSAFSINSPSSHAADDSGRCYLDKFIAHIGYQGVLSAEASLVSLEAALGNEARCSYRVQFSPCIDKGIERLNAAVILRKASLKARKAIMMINITRRIAEHGVEIDYNAEKAGFFSSPKFSKIELAESFFGLPLPVNGEFFDDNYVKGWRYLCELGNMTEAQFLKEIGAGDGEEPANGR